MTFRRSSLRHARLIGWALALGASALAGCQTPQSIGVIIQDDAHVALPWRPLTPAEQKTFDLGYATFNTEWTPANSPAPRTDGLGPLFNAQGCDACHNSRRRGRGPRGDGDAPADLVVQLGRRLPDGSVERGIAAYGRVLNTSAVPGFVPEAVVSIRYEGEVRLLADGTRVSMRTPRYDVTKLSGPALPDDTVLMPRMPPSVQGSGLLERVPQSALEKLADAAQRRSGPIHGRVSRLTGDRGAPIGRFGWQATEPTVASQTASAMSREMGLTTSLISHIDCGGGDTACQSAPTGGTPEVEPVLFDALVLFQSLHAVPAEKVSITSLHGERTFALLGCADCHRPTLPVQTGMRARQVIHPYSDLLLHEMGSGLADRDVGGAAVHSEWRTAPLWGINASVATGQPLRLLHDGRARTIEEAVLWHDGEARDAREGFTRLPADQRRALVAWVEER